MDLMVKGTTSLGFKHVLVFENPLLYDTGAETNGKVCAGNLKGRNV